jgi:hypothetical protein
VGEGVAVAVDVAVGEGTAVAVGGSAGVAGNVAAGSDGTVATAIRVGSGGASLDVDSKGRQAVRKKRAGSKRRKPLPDEINLFSQFTVFNSSFAV